MANKVHSVEALTKKQMMMRWQMSLLINNAIYFGLILFPIACLSKGTQNVAAVFILLCFAAKAIMERKCLIPYNDMTRGIVMFFAAAAISTVFAVKTHTSIEGWFDYLYRFSIFFVAAYSVKTRKHVLWILIATAISIAFFDLFAIWQWQNGVYRAGGFFTNPAILGKYLTMIIPVLFVQAVYNRENRYIFLPVLILSLFELVLNQMRGAWIALGITGIAGCVLMRAHRKQIVIFMSAVLIILVLSFSLTPQLTTRLYSILDMQNESNAERILIWSSAVQMVKDHPITGIGLGNFRSEYVAKYMSPLAKLQVPHAHNTVLHMLVETGLIGAMAFLYMFYMLFRTFFTGVNSSDTWKSSMSITGVLLTAAVFLEGMTAYMFSTSVTTMLFWFVTGVIYASMQIEEP